MPETPLHILLVGYGQMGRLVHHFALERGHTIAQIVDPSLTEPPPSFSPGPATIAIDFSTAGAVMENLRTIIPAGLPTIVGTTGWQEQLPAVREALAQSPRPFLAAPNFSLGVYIFQRIVRYAATQVANLPEYDLWGLELHHHGKADSPSGTARKLAAEVLAAAPRKTSAVYDRLNRKIEPHEFHLASVRGGTANFAHEIGLGSAVDTITLRHEAHDRSGYARGAILAAEWLVSKPAGSYEFSDFAAEQMQYP